MALMRIQARLPRDGGAPEDDSINVWHFDSDQSFEDDADDTVDRLATFYAAIGSLLSPILTGSVTFKVYDMEASEPRVPVFSQITDVFTPGAGAEPAEIAVCISMQATPVSGLNQRRRRGRVYIGPLAAAVTEYTAGQPDVRVEAASITILKNAVEALAHGPDAGDARLAVYSPTNDLTMTTADAFSDVTSGWIDNAFDIQRRRGSVASVRTTWTPA